MRESEGKSKRKWLILLFLAVFLVLFVYTSLNLKNIDYGYKMQELQQQKRQLQEEIDQLKAEKARLENLDRVERIVVEKLGYQPPETSQIIKVFASSDAD